MNKKLKVMVITQNDKFVIPNNILMLAQADFIDLCEIVIIDSPKSLASRKLLFLFGFGPAQCIKLIVKFHIKSVIRYILFLLKATKSKNLTIRQVALKHSCGFRTISDPNEMTFVNECVTKQLDVIVSYSAPTIFKEKLLKAPKFGCINLHCSLLPDFAGSLPSFWTLYHGAEEIGASVHIMDNKIDNGPLLSQVKVKCLQNATIYDNIQITKKMGGAAMLDVLEDISKRQVLVPLDTVRPSYHFGWPTINEIRLFKKKGGKLI
jgi:methionyl-tRNA formyltransferase